MILSYLGSKQTLMPYLTRVLNPIIDQHGGRSRCVFGDLFGGTCIVANTFKDRVKTVIANDLELYSYVLGKSLLQTVYTPHLAQVIDYLNSPEVGTKKGLVWKNFTPACGRMFFTEHNGMRIDAIRIAISELYKKDAINYKEFVFLLASLMASVSRYSNTSGTFRAYLKVFCTRSLRSFKIAPIHKNRTIQGVHHMVKNDALKTSKCTPFDVVYLDPPYNTAHYGAYYSMLNYICLYNSNVELTGVGIMKHYNRSRFGYTKMAKKSICELISSIQSKHIVMSYNANAAIPSMEVVDMMMKRGNVTLYKIWHKNYKPHKGIKSDHVKEFIFVLECTGIPTRSFKQCWLKL